MISIQNILQSTNDHYSSSSTIQVPSLLLVTSIIVQIGFFQASIELLYLADTIASSDSPKEPRTIEPHEKYMFYRKIKHLREKKVHRYSCRSSIDISPSISENWDSLKGRKNIDSFSQACFVGSSSPIIDRGQADSHV